MNQMLSSPGMGSQQTTRLPTHPPPHQPPQLSPNPQPVSTRRPVPNPNDQIGQELQRLQEEKRRLKREQEDVMLKVCKIIIVFVTFCSPLQVVKYIALQQWWSYKCINSVGQFYWFNQYLLIYYQLP